MNKQKFLKVVNPILGLMLTIQILGMTFGRMLPIDPELRFGFHKWNGWALGVVMIVHISLNWSWVKANYFTKKKKG